MVLNEQEVRLSPSFTRDAPVINKDIGDVFAPMKGDEYKNLNDALVDYLLKKNTSIQP